MNNEYVRARIIGMVSFFEKILYDWLSFLSCFLVCLALRKTKVRVIALTIKIEV